VLKPVNDLINDSAMKRDAEIVEMALAAGVGHRRMAVGQSKRGTDT
jgi:hypothetical protein